MRAIFILFSRKYIYSGTKYRTIGYKMSVKIVVGMLFRPFIIKWVEAI